RRFGAAGTDPERLRGVSGRAVRRLERSSVLYARQPAGADMNTLALQLYDATHEQRITGVTAFVGEDASGSFGIRPNHARFMTTLVFGLARFRLGEGWQYLALPGAVLYFNDNELTLSTRHFLVDTDFDRISTLLEQ